MKSLSVALLLFGLVQPAVAETYLVSIDGMDCITCQPKIENAFSQISGVSTVLASTEEKSACLETEANTSVTLAALQTSLTGFDEYTVTDVTLAAECPLNDAKSKSTVRLWHDVATLDAAVITHRERFDLQTIPIAEKYTIIDFGADWCGPCRAAEKTLKEYLAGHPDTAVRAVAMEGKTPAQTFALPVAQQHLKNAAGLPHFIIFSPTRKQLYKGSNLEKALSILDKDRDS